MSTDVVQYLTMKDILIQEDDFDLEEKLEILKDCLVEMDTPQEDIHTYFEKLGGGMYIRQMHVKAGSIIVGCKYNVPQLNILHVGKMSLASADGFREMTAPDMVYCEAGGRKAALILEDVIWTTVVHTNLTDLDEVKKAIYQDSEEG